MLLAVEVAQVEGRGSGLSDSNGLLRKRGAALLVVLQACGQVFLFFDCGTVFIVSFDRAWRLGVSGKAHHHQLPVGLVAAWPTRPKAFGRQGVVLQHLYNVGRDSKSAKAKKADWAVSEYSTALKSWT